MTADASIDALRAQQQRFCAALLGAAPVAGLLRATPQGGAARLDIYRNAYAARLTEALGDNHEVLRRAMGDEAFAALAAAYVAAEPSTQPSIRWFGHRLADFMDETCAAGDAQGLVPHPALADLARMDWALRTAFDAADAPVIGVAELAALPAERWPELRLQCHPSVQCLALGWAVAPVWHAIRQAPEGQEPDLPAPEPLPHTLLVWRLGLATHWRVLDEGEAALLRLAIAGRPLAELFALAADQADADALVQVSGRVARWLADGLVSRLD